MSTLLEDKARRLAQQPYAVKITHDETTDGEPIIVLYNPELPGCMAQGATIQEALDNLLDARQEYILSLLGDNLPVPLPEQLVTRTGVESQNAKPISFTHDSSQRLVVQQQAQSLVSSIDLGHVSPGNSLNEAPDEHEQATVSLRQS